MRSTGIFESTVAVDRAFRARGVDVDASLTLALLGWVCRGVGNGMGVAAAFCQKRYQLYRRKGHYWDEKRLADAKAAFIEGIHELSAHPDPDSCFLGYDRRYSALVDRFERTRASIWREAEERHRAARTARGGPPPWLAPRAEARRAAFRKRRDRAWSRWFAAVRDALARGFEPPPAPGRRRRIGAPIRRLCRRSIHPAPSPATLAAAFEAARGRGRVEEKIRCGSLLRDLEATVDSSLVRTAAGEITGRRPGLRGWIGDHLPRLLNRYDSLMQYRRLAQAFREAHGLRDPYPASILLDDEAPRLFQEPLRRRFEAARKEAKTLLAADAGRTMKDLRAALARREWRRTG